MRTFIGDTRLSSTMAGGLRAPYLRLKEGLKNHAAYTFMEDPEGLTIFYEPYHTEGHTYGDDQERLFLRFRRDGEDLVFTSFDVEATDSSHVVDLSAAREPLMIWLEYLLRQSSTPEKGL